MASSFVRSARLAVVGGAVLLAAGCGGGGNTKSTSTPAPSSGSPTAPASSQASGTSAPAGSSATTGVAATTEAPVDTTVDTGPPVPTTNAQEMDACALLSADEVASAFGGAVVTTEPEAFAPVYGCTWTDAKQDVVKVSVTVFDTPEDAKAAFDAAVSTNHYPTVAGLGDRAYDGAPAFGLTAQKGKYEVDSYVRGTPNDDANQRTLLEKALGRLPS